VIIPSALNFEKDISQESSNREYDRSFFLRDLGPNFKSLANLDRERGEVPLDVYLVDRYGITLSQVADVAFMTYFGTFLSDNVVFEDMHFGNVGIVANEGEPARIVLLDFGGFSENYPKEDKNTILNICLHIFTQDIKGLEKDLYRIVFNSGRIDNTKLAEYTRRIEEVVRKVEELHQSGTDISPVAAVEQIMSAIYTGLPLSPEMLTFCESLRKVSREWLPHVSESSVQSLAMNMFQAIMGASANVSREEGSIDIFEKSLGSLEFELEKSNIKKSDVSSLIENVLRVISGDPAYGQVLEVLGDLMKDDQAYEHLFNKMPEKVREVFSELRVKAQSGGSLREGLSDVLANLNEAFIAGKLDAQEFISVVRILIGLAKNQDSSMYSEYSKSMRKIFDENAKGIGLQLKSLLNAVELKSILSDLLKRERDSDFEDWFAGIMSLNHSPEQIYQDLVKKEASQEEPFEVYDFSNGHKYIGKGAIVYLFMNDSWVKYELADDFRFDTTSINVMRVKAENENSVHRPRIGINIGGKVVPKGYFIREDEPNLRFTFDEFLKWRDSQ
jgi:hypothetical protein